MTDALKYTPSPDIIEAILASKPDLRGRIAYERYGSIVLYGSIEEGAKDDDVIVWAPGEAYDTIAEELFNREFYSEGEGIYAKKDMKLESFRSDDELNNIILTKDLDCYNKHLLASKVVKDLEVYNKPQRIMVYHAICEGAFKDPNEQKAQMGGIRFRVPPAFVQEPGRVIFDEGPAPEPFVWDNNADIAQQARDAWNAIHRAAVPAPNNEGVRDNF